MKDIIVVLVTAKDENEAADIARSLVQKKFAACCNIIKGVRSFYAWDGVLQDDQEALMVIKARRDMFVPIEAEVRRLHSYSTPEIIALPVTEGSEAYLKWVEGAST